MLSQGFCWYCCPSPWEYLSVNLISGANEEHPLTQIKFILCYYDGIRSVIVPVADVTEFVLQIVTLWPFDNIEDNFEKKSQHSHIQVKLSRSKWPEVTSKAPWLKQQVAEQAQQQDRLASGANMWPLGWKQKGNPLCSITGSLSDPGEVSQLHNRNKTLPYHTRVQWEYIHIKEAKYSDTVMLRITYISNLPRRWLR